MTKQITEHAHAAKLIRKELKRRGMKCTVRSSSFAGGNSVNVHVYEDLRPEVREDLESWCKQFEYGTFDGMTDCYHYDNRRDDIPQVKYVLFQVEYSREARDAARAMTWDGETESPAEWLALTRNYANFWDRFEEARH